MDIHDRDLEMRVEQLVTQTRAWCAENLPTGTMADVLVERIRAETLGRREEFLPRE